MTGGKAPVSVPDVMHALATCPSGMRPVPVKDGSEEMRGAPVVVRVIVNGHVIELAPVSWALIPHAAANTDPDKGPVAPEQLARLVFSVRLPPGCVLVEPQSLAPPNLETGLEAIPEGPREISEFIGVDPGIFAVNPDAINAGLREIFAKGKPQDGGNAKPNGD